MVCFNSFDQSTCYNLQNRFRTIELKNMHILSHNRIWFAHFNVVCVIKAETLGGVFISIAAHSVSYKGTPGFSCHAFSDTTRLCLNTQAIVTRDQPWRCRHQKCETKSMCENLLLDRHLWIHCVESENNLYVLLLSTAYTPGLFCENWVLSSKTWLFKPRNRELRCMTCHRLGYTYMTSSTNCDYWILHQCFKERYVICKWSVTVCIEGPRMEL